jgi:hypothetical protein
MRLISYIYDCNYIKIVPLKSRSASEWVKAHDSIHAHVQRFQTKAPISRQRGIDRFEEFLHHIKYRLSAGSVSLPSTQRRQVRHPDFQGTLCGRALLS